MNSIYVLTDDNELHHYGVKGQKWGIRRYQNADGSLTAAAKKRAKEEVKADNKTAFELGRTATIYGHAAAKSMNRTIKLEKKLDKQYEKDPDGASRRTQSLRKKWTASAMTSKQLGEWYTKTRSDAEKHCKSLVKKYGKEAVSDIKYKDAKLKKTDHFPDSFKVMNERTTKMSDYAAMGISFVASFAAGLMGSPIGVISVPKSTRQKAAETEALLYNANRENYR